MKKQFLFVLAFLLAVNVAAFAQQGGGNGQRRTPEERVKATIERLTTELQLNKDQQVKLDTVFTRFYKDMQKLREENQGGGGGNREAFQKLSTERDEKVKAVLTDDQFKKYQAQMEAMRQRGGNRGGGGSN